MRPPDSADRLRTWAAADPPPRRQGEASLCRSVAANGSGWFPSPELSAAPRGLVSAPAGYHGSDPQGLAPSALDPRHVGVVEGPQRDGGGVEPAGDVDLPAAFAEPGGVDRL